MFRIRFVCCLVLLVCPAWVFAAKPQYRALGVGAGSAFSVPVYASVFLDNQRFGVSDSEFDSPVLAAAVGVWGWPGIGLELELGTSVDTGDINNLSLEVHSLTSLNLRLESPHMDGIAAYVLFGFARTHVDSAFSGAVSGRKKFDLRGLRAAFGLTLRASNQLVVDAAFVHHDVEEDIGVNSFRLGLRYDFTRVARRGY